MPTASNVFTILKTSEQFLKSNNIKEAKIDAEVLLCGILNVKKSKLFMMRKETLDEEQLKQYKEYLSRRVAGEPVAYILGKCEFMGLEFYIDSNVLIPRQETELLAEEANNQIKINDFKEVLDICTGSGCIAVSVANSNNNISLTATDISDAAINVARKNSLINNVGDRINFVVSDMFDNINGKKFDIIISNPPYVTKEEFKTLEKELLFEPENALLAKDNGLFFYTEIARNGKKYLNNNGVIALELNSNLSFEIAELFEKVGFIKIKMIKDYSNLDRVLVLKNG